MKIGTGVFGWDGAERRSDRYGAVHLGADPYGKGAVCTPELDLEVVMSLVARKVKMWAIVVETRKSDHLGDLFHKIYPSTPEVGERVELGVGLLGVQSVEWDANPSLILAPADGRTTFWIDPRAFYRLHDQTVELYVEETDEPFHPVPDLKPSGESTVATQEAGSLQSKGRIPKTVGPTFERVGEPGDGMFIMRPPGTQEAGTELPAKYFTSRHDRISDDD